MNQTLLLTDRPNYCSTSASAIGLSKDHVLLDPGLRQHQLLVELTLIDVDHLFASLHQLCDLSHCLQLLQRNLFLLLHLAAVCILRLAVGDLVLLVDLSDSIFFDLDSELLLNQDGPLVQ